MNAAPIRAATILAAGLFAPGLAHAGCAVADLVGGEVRAAAVRPGAARVHLVATAEERLDCPSTAPACRSAAYLVPGDVVLAGHTDGALTCVGSVAPSGRTRMIAWLPTAALAPLPHRREGADWTGRWAAPEQALAITSAANGTLAVSGEATWGLRDPDRMRRGAIHTGAVEGVATPVNGVLAFTEGDGGTLRFDAPEDGFSCRIRMERRGPYLLARENGRCGGVNVTFDGFYRRGQR